jgi:hypothetical protein
MRLTQKCKLHKLLQTVGTFPLQTSSLVVLVILPFLEACVELLLRNDSQILSVFSVTSSLLSDFLSSNSGFSLAKRKRSEGENCGSMEDVVSQECCFQIFSYMHNNMEKGVIGDEAK